MSAPVLALIGVIIAACATVVGVVLRNSKRSPETRTALDAGWDKLTGGLERRLDSLEQADATKQTKLDEAGVRMDQQSDRITDLETTVASQAASLRRMQALNDWLSRRVEQLVAFIVGNDLTPPDEEPRP